MNYRQFEEKPLAAYMRALQRTANFWLFHHVPKTAGSSMAAELRELLPPYRNIHGDPADRTTPQAERLMQATRSFLAAHAESPFRAASGHLRAPHIAAIREAIPNTRLFTILRDPVARVVSEYRYMCTPRHPTHAAHIARYPTLASFVADATTANHMTLYLTRGKPKAAAPIIEQIKASYAFVGFVEDYALSFRFLTMLMFAPVGPRGRRVNETEPTARNAVALDPALTELIAARNAIDVEVYQALRAVYDAKREEMAAAVMEAERG